MTREQLYDHFSLRQELDQTKEVLNALRAAASPGAQALTGMPHAPGVTDKTGDLAAEIIDMEKEIKWMQETIAQEEPEISAFIRTVKPARIRTLFRLRYLRGLSWKEVSLVYGEHSSEATVRTAVYRYMDVHGME